MVQSVTRWLARLLLLAGLAAVLVPGVLACQDMEPSPASVDARVIGQDGAANGPDGSGMPLDAGSGDALEDAGADAGADAGTDAGADAGPPDAKIEN